MAVDWVWNKPMINRQNAEALGKAAKLAYEEETKVRDTLLSWNMKLVRFFDSRKKKPGGRVSTQAYLAQNDSTCILAFRGTQPKEILDWLTDANCMFVKAPKGMVGRVHLGFMTGLDAIWPEVQTALKTERGSRSLWITGHSLGGALAVLATTLLHFSEGKTVNGLYTFGQPRVGDPEFCRCFDDGFGKSTFRFVNFHDVVPRVPLRKMGYEHQGKFFYFNENNYDPDTTWDKVLLRKVGDSVREILQKNDVTDHMMDNYLTKLRLLSEFTNFHDR